MKKQLTAVVISMALITAGAAPVLAESVPMPGASEISAQAAQEMNLEELAAKVKAKLDIPEEYTEFTIDRATYDDGIDTYNLRWQCTGERYNSISVSCDGSGHIKDYHAYIYNDSRSSLVTDLREDVLSDITAQVKKMLPECFENENDTYKIDASTFTMYGSGTAEFLRFRDGIKVWNNEIHVEFGKDGDTYKIEHITSSHDYDAVFGENTDGENIKERYRELAKSELQYNLVYQDGDRNPVLRYVINNAPFMDPVTGEAVEEDIQDSYYPYRNAAEGSADMVTGAASSKDMGLTEQEIAEINKVNGLKTVEEIEAQLRVITELGITGDMEISSKRIYKSDEKYYMQLSFANDEKGSERKYMDITVNAENGKLCSVYCTDIYYDSYHEPMTDEELAGVSGGEDFLKKYADGFDGYELTDKSGYKTSKDFVAGEEYNKSVNGIPFTSDSVSIKYNTETNQVYSMWMNSSNVDGEFPDPSKAVSAEEAFDTLISVYPLASVFVKSEGIYKKAYVLPARSSYVDAIENMVVTSWNNEPIKGEVSYSYNDISGHWAESIIKNFAQFGIGLEGESFRPDEEITVGDFSELVSAVMGGYTAYPISKYVADASDEDIESVDENAPVTRELAVKCIIDRMGWSKVAGLKDIFVTHFDDEAEMEPDCIGYCAIAKGLGIITGDGGKFMPKRNITRAEAAAMLYKCKINQQ